LGLHARGDNCGTVSTGNNKEHFLKILKIWEKLKDPYIISDKNIINNLNTVASGEELPDLENK
jgi:hypothetical protein